MTKEHLATTTAAVGAGLLFASGGWHLSAYAFIVAQATSDARPLLAALWIACGITLWLAALLVVAVTPLQIIRRRALLFIAALTPVPAA